MIFMIATVCIVVFTFLIVRAPNMWMKLWKRYMLRTLAAIILIVCLNMIGNGFGIHVPINIFTVLLTSVLGIPGLMTIIGLQYLFL